MFSIQKIQKWMRENNKDIFIINRTDEFLNEYIASYAERLKWISNFTGSAGRAIIEQDNAYLFIDGRYTSQVNQEVNLNFFNIKHIQEYWIHINQYIDDDKIIIMDPFLHSVKEVEKMKKIFFNSKIVLNFLNKNPIDIIWKNQPPIPTSKAFIHEYKYSGESAENKINKIQKILKLNYIDFYLLNSLDSIAWLLNLRGNDIKYTPLLFCYIIIPQKGNIELFIDRTKIKHLIKNLSNFINFNSLEEIDEYLLSIDLKKKIGIDEKVTPYYFKNICNKKNLALNHLENPCLYPKSIKNDIEIKGARSANLRDGVSVSKFLYWLKKNALIKNVDEIQAANYLFNLRKKNNLFYSLSFETISAFGLHAALPHYMAKINSNLSFKKNSIYLVDSGAQYKDGTTDITRTIVIGNPTNEQKDRFTRVLKGHIGISEAVFQHNTKGSSLDPIARKFLHEINCDYDHSTGHGVGNFLSVHEGPQRISKSNENSGGAIMEGMILSNEPGYYKKNEYGIRIENLIICRSQNDKKLFFETISWAPYDIDLIDQSLLTKKEIRWINNYHKNVYKKISPKLNYNERQWLKFVTLPM